MENYMGARRLFFLLLLITTCLAAGCYRTPVRHLAADVALLKIGESTQEDVFIYLGQPDHQRDLGGGVVQYSYRDQKKAFLEKTPLVGKYTGNPEYLQVIVTLSRGIVSDLVFNSADEDDAGWRNDFSWQQ